MTTKADALSEQRLTNVLWRIVRTIAEFGSAQGFAQIAGMVTGLIFVRQMPVGEYAVYALAMTAFSVISVGSDLGLNGSLAYFWRQSLAENKRPWRRVEAVRKLRLLLFWGALTVACAVLISSPVVRATSTLTILTLAVLLALTGWLQVRNSLNLTLMRLQGELSQSYLCEVIGNIVRLAAVVMAVAVITMTAAFGLFVGLLGALALAISIKYSMRMEMPAGERISLTHDDWRDLRAYIVPVLPGVAVYIIQEPLILWMTAKYAGAVTVAEVFALSRISAILGLVGSFVYIVLIPRLAQITDSSRFNLMLFLFSLGLAGLLGTLVIMVAIAPGAVLWLLGKSYAHLDREMLVGVVATSILTLGSLISLSNRVRGWIAIDPYVAFIQFAALLVTCLLWDYSNTLSVMLLGLALAVISFTCSVSILALGVVKPAFVSAKISSPAYGP